MNPTTSAPESGAPTLPSAREAIGRPRAYAATLRQRIDRRFDERRGRGMAILLLSAAVLILLGFVAMMGLMLTTPEVESLGRQDFEQATIVFTADGQELTRYYDQNRTWAPLDSIAPVVVDALIATEDRRFYRHWGIDVRRTISASLQTVSGETQGGSTITMQVARNAFPKIGDDFMLKRKAREWLTALRIESEFSKDQILEIYLNSVPFNYEAYGIDAAAQTYFSKDAARLDTLEAATLIGMLKGTTIYNPVLHPEDSHERRNVVLSQMHEAGYLTEADFDRLTAQPTPLRFSPLTRTRNLAPYFADHVRGIVEDWAETNGLNPYRDGLRVYTTLDSDIQRQAEEAVNEQLEYLQSVVDVTWSQANIPLIRGSRAAFEDARTRVDPFAYFWEANPEVLPALVRRSERFRELAEQGADEDALLERMVADTSFVDSLKSIYTTLQAGFVAMDPGNGHIKAWIGGREYARYPYDHVADARRQPGSTFKPFVYATALEQGISPLDSLRDAEVTYVAPQTGQSWTPGNFGEESGEIMAVRDGLAHSKNTITARLILEVGPESVVDMAHRMGIESELNAVPSLALGTSEVSLLEMVAAYGTIVNLGTYHEPVSVTRIEDADGRVLAQFAGDTRQAVEPGLAYTLLDMMRGVVDYGTGVRIRSEFGASGDLGAKTGTTQEGADGWFMLVHPDLVMGAWVGFPSPALTFRTRYWGQGAHNALRIVGDFVRKVGLSPSARFEQPEGYRMPSPGRLRASDTSAVDLPELSAGDGPESDGEPDDAADTLVTEEPLSDEPLTEEAAEPDEDANGEAEPTGDEADSEADRLNRQERQSNNLDRYLEDLERDG